MLAEALGIAATVGALGIGVLWWYHGYRTRALVTRAEAAEAALGIVKSVNAELRASLDRVVADVAARNAREAQDDARTASAAAATAGAAAALLNSLHPSGASTRAVTVSELPKGKQATVSDAIGDTLL